MLHTQIIIDLFFLTGLKNNKVIFDIVFGYLRLIEPNVLKCVDMESLGNALDSENLESMDQHDFFSHIEKSH